MKKAKRNTDDFGPEIEAQVRDKMLIALLDKCARDIMHCTGRS